MSPRMSAEDRREQVLREAIPVFARYGFEGATTAEIAKRAGVAQPYVIKLFETKKALFIAACERNMRTTQAQMRDSAGGKSGHDAMEAMGHAYVERMESDRDSLLLQMQQYAACWDEDIQRTVRQCMQDIWNMVVEISGAPLEEIAVFFAKGMFCNVIAAAGRSDGKDPQWLPVLTALWPDRFENSGASGDREDPDAAGGEGPGRHDEPDRPDGQQPARASAA
ncbi:TetR/AcrR family transcriptional regulator [Actinospica durhamensis]|uniref:TetR/AcrR family transcriptional regulator n=1 Tax=Actinospica durhamensis TaxID=1508375 RepID=A0A941EPW6_9ACTN|nr:TetR/AcrR family transcriptional regulator [Actinospica durhamensis]MBR7835742.1 TetR/AcrR family transcriptional regulator [Actinospica durhamensis]